MSPFNKLTEERTVAGPEFDVNALNPMNMLGNAASGVFNSLIKTAQPAIDTAQQKLADATGATKQELNKLKAQIAFQKSTAQRLRQQLYREQHSGVWNKSKAFLSENSGAIAAVGVIGGIAFGAAKLLRRS